MVEVLTIIFAFITFMVVLGKGYLAAIRPASLMILIIVSLVVGYVLAVIIAWILSTALKFLIPIIIIGIVIMIFKK